jgi:hypothetical protein
MNWKLAEAKRGHPFLLEFFPNYSGPRCQVIESGSTKPRRILRIEQGNRKPMPTRLG